MGRGERESVMDPLMQEAWRLTNGDRRNAYGDPKDVFAAYAMAWTAILQPKLREPITGAEATLMMAALKICREAHNVKADNVTDAHGYLSLHSRVVGLIEEPHTPTEDEWKDLGRPGELKGL